MIKFLGMGKKKPETVKKLGKGFIPTDKVKDLSKKGFSEPEIIDVLRKEGFSADEIDSALTQALKIGVTGEEEKTEKLPTLRELQAEQTSPSGGLSMFDEEQTAAPEIPEPSLQYPQQYYPQEGYGTEELVETIVQEKMNELNQKLIEFREKYSALERRMSDLHHQLSIMAKGRSETEQTIISKLDSFKDTINDINARLSSLEKAFKEALPALIESVRSLTDLVQRLKSGS